MLRRSGRRNTTGLDSGRTHGYFFNKGIDVNQHPLKSNTYFSSKNFTVNNSGSLVLRDPVILEDDNFKENVMNSSYNTTESPLEIHDFIMDLDQDTGLYITNKGIFRANAGVYSTKLDLKTSSETTSAYITHSDSKALKIGTSIVISNVSLEGSPNKKYFARYYIEEEVAKLDWVSPDYNKGEDLEDLNLYVDELGKFKNNYNAIGFYVYTIHAHLINDGTVSSVKDFLESENVEYITTISNESEVTLRAIFDSNRIRYDNPDVYYAYWQTSIDGGETWTSVPEFETKFENKTITLDVAFADEDGNTVTENVKMVEFNPEKDDELIENRPDFINVTPIQGQMYRFCIGKRHDDGYDITLETEDYTNDLTSITEINIEVPLYNLYLEHDRIPKKISNLKTFYHSTNKTESSINDKITTTHVLDNNGEDTIPLSSSITEVNLTSDNHMLDDPNITSTELTPETLPLVDGKDDLYCLVGQIDFHAHTVKDYKDFNFVFTYQINEDSIDGSNTINMDTNYFRMVLEYEDGKSNGENKINPDEVYLTSEDGVPTYKLVFKNNTRFYNYALNLKIVRIAFYQWIDFRHHTNSIHYNGEDYVVDSENNITIDTVAYNVPMNDIVINSNIQNLYKHELSVEDAYIDYINSDIFKTSQDSGTETPYIDLKTNIVSNPEVENSFFELSEAYPIVTLRSSDLELTKLAFTETLLSVGSDWQKETNDIPIPSSAKYLETYGKSIYAYGGENFTNNVLVSRPDEFYFPVSRLLDIPGMSGSSLTSMLFWRNYVLTAFDDSIYLSERINEGFLTKPTNTSIGIPEDDSETLKTVLNSIVFKNRNRVYSLKPSYTSSTDSLLYIKTISDNLGDNFIDAPEGKKSTSYVTDEYYNILVNHSTENEKMTLLYKYNLEHRFWVTHVLPIDVQFIHTISVNKILAVDSEGAIYNIGKTKELIKYIPYGDYLTVNVKSIEALNNDFLDSDGEIGTTITQEEYDYVKNSVIPIEFAVDSGDKAPSLNGSYNFTKSKIVFFDGGDTKLDIDIYINGRLHKHHTGLMGTETKLTKDSMVWANEIVPSGLVLGTSALKTTKDLSTMVKELSLRSSGKGKSIRHIISGKSVSSLSLNMVYYKYRNLNVN